MIMPKKLEVARKKQVKVNCWQRIECLCRAKDSNPKWSTVSFQNFEKPCQAIFQGYVVRSLIFSSNLRSSRKKIYGTRYSKAQKISLIGLNTMQHFILELIIRMKHLLSVNLRIKHVQNFWDILRIHFLILIINVFSIMSDSKKIQTLNNAVFENCVFRDVTAVKVELDQGSDFALNLSGSYENDVSNVQSRRGGRSICFDQKERSGCIIGLYL